MLEGDCVRGVGLILERGKRKIICDEIKLLL